MTPGSLAWRQAYARGLTALRTLQGGGTHQRGVLFGPKDPWSDQLIDKLLKQGLMAEAGADMFRAESGGKLGRVLAHERNLCGLLGLGLPEYASEAAVLAADPSLLDSSRVVDKLIDIFGVDLLQNRFGIASPRLRAMRAVARMPENVAVAVEQAKLSAMHAIALAQAPAVEATMLTLIDLTRAHALSARELQSISMRVRNGISVERAVLDAGLVETTDLLETEDAPEEPEEAPGSQRPGSMDGGWPMSVVTYARHIGVRNQALYQQIKRRKTGAGGELIELHDGAIAVAPTHVGEHWRVYPNMQAAEARGAYSPPVTSDATPAAEPSGEEEYSVEELIAASFKVSMACLDIVRQMHRRVDFLARELGYKEDADAPR